MPLLHVHLLPSLVPAGALDDATAVVIDVLRATTTITAALAAGATHVVPCVEVEEARHAAANDPSALLGGERGGLRIDGFDLGNSPGEYTAEVVGGRSIVFTTTNGTRALHACRAARVVYLAAFTNLSAVCDRIANEPTHIVCAGTNTEITREDVLLAGAIVDALQPAAQWTTNDQAEIAADAWRQAVRWWTACPLLADELQRSRGGRNLLEHGLEDDIRLAAEVDRCAVVPRYLSELSRIVTDTGSGRSRGK